MIAAPVLCRTARKIFEVGIAPGSVRRRSP